MKQEYFSEDELEKFLEDVEENYMHTAPFYLKQEIMEQAFSKQLSVYTGHEKRKLSRAQKRTWIMYNCKVVLASATAILFLFLIPTGENSIMQGENVSAMSQVTDSIGTKSEQICDVLSKISDKMIIDCSGFQIKESEE